MMYYVLLKIIKTFPYNDGEIYNNQLKNNIMVWSNLVSAQGPLVLVFGLKGLGQGLTINLIMVGNTQSLDYNEVCCIQIHQEFVTIYDIMNYDGSSGTWSLIL